MKTILHADLVSYTKQHRPVLTFEEKVEYELRKCSSVEEEIKILHELSKNPNLTPELVWKYPDKPWDMEELQYNPGTRWSSWRNGPSLIWWDWSSFRMTHWILYRRIVTGVRR